MKKNNILISILIIIILLIPIPKYAKEENNIAFNGNSEIYQDNENDYTTTSLNIKNKEEPIKDRYQYYEKKENIKKIVVITLATISTLAYFYIVIFCKEEE